MCGHGNESRFESFLNFPEVLSNQEGFPSFTKGLWHRKRDQLCESNVNQDATRIDLDDLGGEGRMLLDFGNHK